MSVNLKKAAAACGGTLISVSIPPIPPGKNGGCGSRTHVVGTNGGTMPCGDLLTQFGKTEPYYCDHCSQQKEAKVSKRFKNADAIWNGGACNPRGVARTLVEAVDEAVIEGGGSAAAADPAVQMILDQLCFLCGLPQPSLDMPTEHWVMIMDEVEKRK